MGNVNRSSSSFRSVGPVLLCPLCVESGNEPYDEPDETSEVESNASARDEDFKAASFDKVRGEVRRRLQELSVATEVAERLIAASDQEPNNPKKARAASEAVKRLNVARNRATPEAVMEDLALR